MYNLGNININPTLNAGNVSTPFMKGEQGYSISRVARTEGTGESGTTDIYTVYINTDPETAVGTFSVYNGAGGDMFKSVYDINNDGIVDKATADANGNDITTTYETISNVGAIDTRVTTLENAGYITKAVNDLINYYTKTEIDSSGFITKSVNDLTNYYTKTDIDNKAYITKDVGDLTYYYTKTEIDTLVGNIETLLQAI